MNRLGMQEKGSFLLNTKVGNGLLFAGWTASSAISIWIVLTVLEHLTKMSFR